MASFTTRSINQNICFVKPPELPPNYKELVELRYRRSKGVAAAEALAQGERDILELVRQALGWNSIYSLAYKWYPLYPYRHDWKRALEKCSQQKLKTRTLNLKYLLLAVITQVKLSLMRAFSGKASLNRLLHRNNTNNSNGSYRLTHPNKYLNPKPGGYQEIVLKRQGLIPI